MDILGFKKRKAIKQARKRLTEQFNCKKIDKHIRNIERLAKWIDAGHAQGVALICRYLEDNGLPPPKDTNECKILIEALNVERKLLAC